jgi:uncharacterized protein DUF4288
MSWFMAVIVRGSFTEHGYDSQRMGDLLFKLVEAPDAETAHARAVALGEAARDTYQDEEGADVTLQYLGLADLMEITAGQPAHGVEVYSEAIDTKPMDRVVDKGALTAFAPWEVPEGADEEPDEPSEPGADRFRAGPLRDK